MITLLSQQPGAFGAAHGGLEFLLDATIKGSVILVAALLVASALRATSATNRYLVWSMAICSLLAIPLLSGLMPKWRVPVLPALDADRGVPASENPPKVAAPSPVEAAIPEQRPPELTAAHEYLDMLMRHALAERSSGTMAPTDDRDEASASPMGSAGDDVRSQRPGALSAAFSPAQIPWTAWIIATWLAGAAVFGAVLAAGILRIRSLTRSALPLEDDRWAAMLRNVAREVGVERPVTLRQCRQVRTPVTWGHYRPVILLPTECRRWSASRRRVVLLHELVHIRRRDWVMQILSQIIGATYWFNPLVWVAVRRLAIERERACDDQVLGHGARPSEYAGHLLDIARTLASGGQLTMASLGMAHRTQLEGRLLAILDPKRPRRGFGRVATLTAIVGMGAGVLPLAAMSPWAEPALAAPAIQDTVMRVGDELQIRADDNFNFSWTDDDEDLAIRLRINGEVVLTDEGVESISEDGQVRITVTEDDETRRLVIRRGDDGEPAYTLTVDGEKREMTAADRRWARRIITQAVAKLREFDKDMADLKVQMDDLHEEMADLHLRLGDIGHIEIPELKLEGLMKLGQLGELGKIPAMHLDDAELKALKGHLGQLHMEMPHMEHLKALGELGRLGEMHIEMPDMEHLKASMVELEKLKTLGLLHERHVQSDDEDEDDADKLKEKVKRHLEQQGQQWRQAAPDAKAIKEQIRRQIQEQMKALQEQLERLEQDGDGFELHFDPERHHIDADALREKFQGAWRGFDGLQWKVGPGIAEWDENLGAWKMHMPKWQEWQGKLQEHLNALPNDFDMNDVVVTLPKFDADFWKQHQHELQAWQEHLRENLGELHELPHFQMPDLKGLHLELAPMLEKLHGELPKLKGLHERIDRQLQPQMKKLQERLKALDEHIKVVRGEMTGGIRDAIAAEVNADGLSRGGQRQIENAINDLAGRLGERLGFRVDDGVCALNDSAREIASRIERALEDMSAKEFDYDDAILERLEKAAKAIAERLTDLEIEIDPELLKKIESFDGDFDFQFDFGGDDDDDNDDDNDDDDDVDDDDGWGAGAVA